MKNKKSPKYLSWTNTVLPAASKGVFSFYIVQNQGREDDIFYGKCKCAGSENTSSSGMKIANKGELISLIIH